MGQDVQKWGREFKIPYIILYKFCPHFETQKWNVQKWGRDFDVMTRGWGRHLWDTYDPLPKIVMTHGCVRCLQDVHVPFEGRNGGVLDACRMFRPPSWSHDDWDVCEVSVTFLGSWSRCLKDIQTYEWGLDVLEMSFPVQPSWMTSSKMVEPEMMSYKDWCPIAEAEGLPLPCAIQDDDQKWLHQRWQPEADVPPAPQWGTNKVPYTTYVGSILLFCLCKSKCCLTGLPRGIKRHYLHFGKNNALKRSYFSDFSGWGIKKVLFWKSKLLE